jgi:hypothetical protein
MFWEAGIIAFSIAILGFMIGEKLDKVALRLDWLIEEIRTKRR